MFYVMDKNTIIFSPPRTAWGRELERGGQKSIAKRFQVKNYSAFCNESITAPKKRVASPPVTAR